MHVYVCVLAHFNRIFENKNNNDKDLTAHFIAANFQVFNISNDFLNKFPPFINSGF